MKINQTPYHLHPFILRRWPEVVDREQWEWRAEVKNTITGEIYPFHEWLMLVRPLPTFISKPVAHEISDDEDANNTS